MDWLANVAGLFGRPSRTPRAPSGASGGRSGAIEDEEEALGALDWGPEEWNRYLTASSGGQPGNWAADFGQERPTEPLPRPENGGQGRFSPLLGAVSGFIQATKRALSVENDPLWELAQGKLAPVREEVGQAVVRGLVQTPVGQQVLTELAKPETAERVETWFAGLEDAIQGFADSNVAYEMDMVSAGLAEYLIQNGWVRDPGPENYSGAGGRPIMMDVMKAEGFGDAEAFLAEIVVPGTSPSIGGIPGVDQLVGTIGGTGAAAAAMLLTRNMSDMLQRVVRSTPDLLDAANTAFRATDDALGQAATTVARVQEDLIPPPLRQVPAFRAKLDEVQARYTNLDPADLRRWEWPDQTRIFDDIPRGPDGAPTLRTKDNPNGITPTQLENYHATRARAIEAHGGLENLERALEEGYQRGLATLGQPNDPGDWYPQQRVLNRIQDAVGDDLVGRALFEHLNDMHARASSRSQPRNQALRAVYLWAHELLGVNPAAMTNVPTGMGSLAHRSQALQVGLGSVRDAILSLFGQPKNSAYARSLSGNLGDIVADVHYYRTIMNDLFLPTDEAARVMNAAGTKLVKRKRLPFETADIGAYLAVRDLGMPVAQRLGVQPGELQQRVWGGNAKLTGVDGAVEPFDYTAAGAFDAIMRWLGRKAGITDPDPADILGRVLRGDPSMQQALETSAPDFLRMADAPGDALENYVRGLDPEGARQVVLSGAQSGAISSVVEAMRVVSEHDLYRAFDTTDKRLRVVRPVFEAMAENPDSPVTHAHLASFMDYLKSRSAKGRWENAWTAYEARLPRIIEASRAPDGGFTFDITTRRMPGLGQGVRGYSVSPYPEVGVTRDRAILDDADATAEMMAEFFLTRAKLLALPNHGIGGWADKGLFYLDVSVMPKQRAAGEQLGQMGHQFGMFSFEEGFIPFDAPWATGGADLIPSRPGGLTNAEWDAQLVDLAWRRAKDEVIPYMKKRPGLEYPRETQWRKPGRAWGF